MTNPSFLNPLAYDDMDPQCPPLPTTTTTTTTRWCSPWDDHHHHPIHNRRMWSRNKGPDLRTEPSLEYGRYPVVDYDDGTAQRPLSAVGRNDGGSRYCYSYNNSTTTHSTKSWSRHKLYLQRTPSNNRKPPPGTPPSTLGYDAGEMFTDLRPKQDSGSSPILSPCMENRIDTSSFNMGIQQPKSEEAHRTPNENRGPEKYADPLSFLAKISCAVAYSEREKEEQNNDRNPKCAQLPHPSLARVVTAPWTEEAVATSYNTPEKDTLCDFRPPAATNYLHHHPNHDPLSYLISYHGSKAALSYDDRTSQQHHAYRRHLVPLQEVVYNKNVRPKRFPSSYEPLHHPFCSPSPTATTPPTSYDHPKNRKTKFSRRHCNLSSCRSSATKPRVAASFALYKASLDANTNVTSSQRHYASNVGKENVSYDSNKTDNGLSPWVPCCSPPSHRTTYWSSPSHCTTYKVQPLATGNGSQDDPLPTYCTPRASLISSRQANMASATTRRRCSAQACASPRQILQATSLYSYSRDKPYPSHCDDNSNRIVRNCTANENCDREDDTDTVRNNKRVTDSGNDKQTTVIIIRKKFSWKDYPELEQLLLSHREEFMLHSTRMNYRPEQKRYNNWLTQKLLQKAVDCNYVFAKEDFDFVAVRDRIRCYYKSYAYSLARSRRRCRGVGCFSHPPARDSDKQSRNSIYSPLVREPIEDIMVG